MSLLEKLGQQPRSWIIAEACACVVIIAGIDLMTTWQFSMFFLYCLPVYLMGLYTSRRTAIWFALFVTAASTLATLDSLPYRGWGGFAWASLNRFVGLLIAAFGGISFRDYREETHHRMQALQRTQELEREIVRAGEREQKRIGQDLHDGVCQTLAALDCAAQCLKLDLEKDQSPRAPLAEEIQRQLSTATIEARNMARGIYPVSISTDSLSVSIETLVRNMNRLCNEIIVFENDSEVNVSDAETATHLYRITQEALSNAMRHANATRIHVSIEQRDEQVVITVADNGAGSSIQKRPDGMGWHTMRYRANVIGALITVHPSPSKGTVVRCTLANPTPAASSAPAASLASPAPDPASPSELVAL